MCIVPCLGSLENSWAVISGFCTSFYSMRFVPVLKRTALTVTCSIQVLSASTRPDIATLVLHSYSEQSLLVWKNLRLHSTGFLSTPYFFLTSRSFGGFPKNSIAR